MAENDWKKAGNGWKFLKVTGSGRQWPEET